jgi:hypothetical protein
MEVVRDRAWQFAGVVVSLIFGIAALVYSNSGEPASEPPPSVNVTGNISGDCNGLGSGVTVSC